MSMQKLDRIEDLHKKEEIPHFRSGDTVKVHYLIQEGGTERVQVFDGRVVSRKGSGLNETFTVRKISLGGIGVERIFPLHSPRIEKIELDEIGKVRRSKLYYLRDKEGKSARIERSRKGG